MRGRVRLTGLQTCWQMKILTQRYVKLDWTVSRRSSVLADFYHVTGDRSRALSHILALGAAS